jgi:hypothetical protein
MDRYQKHRLVNYHIESRRRRLTTREGYDFAFVPPGADPETAKWRYDQHLRRHNIIFNSALDSHADRDGLTYYDKSLFTQRVYDHEGAHSLFTTRDNKLLGDLQAKWKVPFHLWNLFEDSRIEANWRKKFGRRFKWLRYLLTVDEEPVIPAPIPAPETKEEPKPISAIRLYLDCIRMENSPTKLNAWVEKDKDPEILFEGKGKRRYRRRNLVRWYYRQAIRKHKTENLLSLIASWIKTFPETSGEGEGVILILDMPNPEKKEGEGAEAAMPKEAEDADGSKHKPIHVTIKLSGSGGGSEDSSETPMPAKVKYVDDKESKKVEIPVSKFFSKNPVREMNFKRGENLIRLFEKFLEGGEGIVTSRNPTGRIDMRRFLRGAEDIYLRKGDDPYGVKKISFILDCSGSMSHAIEDGVYLAFVLNELVRRRKIECQKMIVCGGSNQAVPMPFNPEILRHLMAPGSIEGFAHAMREHEKDLLASDLTIFFTDGDITDEHIKKADWHRKGVYTIGLFVGDPSRSAALHTWFDSVLVRNSIESVADSLIQLIKR